MAYVLIFRAHWAMVKSAYHEQFQAWGTENWC
jgi:hypothetical protein